MKKYDCVSWNNFRDKTTIIISSGIDVSEKLYCGGIKMAHALIRATLVQEIVRLIKDRFNVSEKEALDKFYTSATGESFSDDETGLYGQSALYIFGLFIEEINDMYNGKI